MKVAMLFLEDETYKSLPKIFHADDYNKCVRNGGKYCEFEIELSKSSLSNNFSLWETIEKTKHIVTVYDHSQLFYKKCVTDESKIDGFFSNFENLGLNATIKNMSCPETLQFSFSFYDIIFVFGLSCYGLLVFYATCLHIFPAFRGKTEFNKFFKCFSLKYNLEQLLDYEKITGTTKSLQGIRVILALNVILIHEIVHQISAYVENTAFQEKYTTHPVSSRLTYIIHNYIEMFFVMSAFILSIQVHKIYEEHKKFTLKQIFLLALNRYLRFMGIVAFCGMLISCDFVGIIFSYRQNNLLYRQVNACRTNWLKVVLMINNYGMDEKCLPGTWYTSADYQIYLTLLLLMYITIKFKLKFRITIGVCAVIALLCQFYIIYTNNLPHTFKIKPKYQLLEKLISSDNFEPLHTSAIPHLLSGLIGIYLGRLHFNKAQNEIFAPKSKNRTIWWTVIVLAYALSLELSAQNFGRFGSALVGSFVKSLFGLAFGMMIFAIMHDGSSLVKKILENKIVLIISSLTYCIYNIHFAIVFSRQFPQPAIVSVFDIINRFCLDSTIVLILCTLAYLFIELPFYNLQRNYVPQVSTKKKTDKAE